VWKKNDPIKIYGEMALEKNNVEIEQHMAYAQTQIQISKKIIADGVAFIKAH